MAVKRFRERRRAVPIKGVYIGNDSEGDVLIWLEGNIDKSLVETNAERPGLHEAGGVM